MNKLNLYLIAFALTAIVVVYSVHVGFSLMKRGEVNQDYWYCDVYMEDKENGFSFPHHRGHKPLIPFSDHLCGDNELDLAKRNGWQP